MALLGETTGHANYARLATNSDSVIVGRDTSSTAQRGAIVEIIQNGDFSRTSGSAGNLSLYNWISAQAAPDQDYLADGKIYNGTAMLHLRQDFAFLPNTEYFVDWWGTYTSTPGANPSPDRPRLYFDQDVTATLLHSNGTTSSVTGKTHTFRDKGEHKEWKSITTGATPPTYVRYQNTSGTASTFGTVLEQLSITQRKAATDFIPPHPTHLANRPLPLKS